MAAGGGGSAGGGGGAGAGGALTVEEFVRLQEQLLALKMQNHDLEEVNRRARNAAGPAPAAGPTAADLAQKLSSQLKVGAEAVSAFGTKSAASLRSTLAPDGGAWGADTAALLAEVAPLRERLRAALEELAAAKKAAMAAQQAAALSSLAPGSQGLSAEALRRELALAEDCALPDWLLQRIASASLQLAEAKRRDELARREQAQASALSEGDAHLGMLVQIQKQQRDLENLSDAVDKQHAQIGRLSDQASLENAMHPDNQQGLEDRLRATERHLGELSKRLAASDGISSQTYELRCHLQAVHKRTQQRDEAIEGLLVRQEAAQAEQAQLQEAFGMAQEDLLAGWLQGWRDAAAPHPTAPGGEERASAQRPATPRAEAEATHGPLGDLPPSPSSGSRSPPAARRPDWPSVEVQADLSSEEGATGSSQETLEALRARLQELREEKAAFERRSAKEVQELRALLRSSTDARRRAGAEEEAPPGLAERPGAGLFEGTAAGLSGAGASAPPADAAGFLYVQKIAELEALRDGLERDLDLLRSSQQCLLEDGREKEELIRGLMRTAHFSSPGPEDTSDARVPKAKPSGSVASAVVGGVGALRHLWRRGKEDKHADIDELERVAEEAMLDNLRLRKDLKGIAEEFRKALALQRGAS